MQKPSSFRARMKYKNKVHDVYKVAFKLANNAKLVKLSEYVYVFEF